VLHSSLLLEPSQQQAAWQQLAGINDTSAALIAVLAAQALQLAYLTAVCMGEAEELTEEALRTRPGVMDAIHSTVEPPCPEGGMWRAATSNHCCLQSCG
jgi:hypothetical protein